MEKLKKSQKPDKRVYEVSNEIYAEIMEQIYQIEINRLNNKA